MRWVFLIAAIALTTCEGDLGTHWIPKRGNAAPWHVVRPITGKSGPLAQVIAEARDALMGTRDDLPVGRACGYGAAPPSGHWFVEYLLAARREDILAQAFQSAPTMEGRVWAAYGLAEAGKLTFREARAFTQSLTRVLVCLGCIVEEGTGADAARLLFTPA